MAPPGARLLVRSTCSISTGLMCLMRIPSGPPAAGACRAAGRGAQGDVVFGGAVVNLGGGGDEPAPDPNGGGDSVRVFQSCSDGTCQFAEVRMVYGAVRLHASGTTQAGLCAHAGNIACTRPCMLQHGGQVMFLLPSRP